MRISREGSKFLDGISKGWPAILSSLKSMLETGTPLDHPARRAVIDELDEAYRS